MSNISIGQDRTGISIYLNKKIRLFVTDNQRVQPRDGILRDFDDVNYYIESTFGSTKGCVIAFLKTSVLRIEPIIDNYKGGHHY